MAVPAMSPADARQHATFTALMWALSYPGRPARLPAAGPEALATIGETLVDLETGFFTPDPALAARLARTGGRSLPAAAAPYQFFPRLSPAELELLAAAPLGSHAEPDLGATVVVGCDLIAERGATDDDQGAGQVLRLSGPGVPGECVVQVAGLPAELWPLRAAAVRPPLGWDLFLVAGALVLGLPRTTAVEVLPWPM